MIIKFHYRNSSSTKSFNKERKNKLKCHIYKVGVHPTSLQICSFKKQSYESFKYFCIIIFNDIINNLLFCWFTARVLKLEICKRVFSTFNQEAMSILVVLDLTKLFGVSGHIFCMFQELSTVQYTEYVCCNLRFDYMMHTNFFWKDIKIFSKICWKYVQCPYITS